MWKWIKGLFTKKENDFTGFKVEIYRGGKVLTVHYGSIRHRVGHSCTKNPIIFKGPDGTVTRLYGYTLVPEWHTLEQ